MINRLVFLSLFVTLGMCNNSPLNHYKNEQLAEQKQDSLKILANKLTKAYDSINTNPQEFFEIFPDNYYLFNQLYGFDDKTGEGLLYKKYQQHINAFCNTSNVAVEFRLGKMIKIGFNGHWEADAVAMLQKCTVNLIKYNIKSAISILNKNSNQENLIFWQYLFDGPHPKDKQTKMEFDELYKLVLSIDSSQSKLLKKGYDSLVSKNSH